MSSLLKASVASIVLHVLVLGLMPKSIFSPPSMHPAQTPKEKIMRVVFQSRPKGQVVDVTDEKHTTLTPPSHAKYLSDRHRQVQQETQARVTQHLPQPPQSVPEANQRPSDSSIKKGFGKKSNLNLSQKFLKHDALKNMMKNNFTYAPTNHLPNVAMGDETLLNTREYTFATFFVRMKRQMEMVWNPRKIMHGEDLKRNQYVTSVQIILNADGSLNDSRIIESSGNELLDQEALIAVERGAPYRNPPEGLKDEDQKIRIPRWQFIVSKQGLF